MDRGVLLGGVHTGRTGSKIPLTNWWQKTRSLEAWAQLEEAATTDPHEKNLRPKEVKTKGACGRYIEKIKNQG